MLAPSLLLALPLLAAAAPVLNGSMAPPPPVGGVDTSALSLRPSPAVVTLAAADPAALPCCRRDGARSDLRSGRRL
jgi:hypothetical protein